MTDRILPCFCRRGRSCDIFQDLSSLVSSRYLSLASVQFSQSTLRFMSASQSQNRGPCGYSSSWDSLQTAHTRQCASLISYAPFVLGWYLILFTCDATTPLYITHVTQSLRSVAIDSIVSQSHHAVVRGRVCSSHSVMFIVRQLP